MVECGVDLAGLLGDKAGVRFAVRLPSEVHDLESIDVFEAAPGCRDDVFFQRSIGRGDNDSVECIRIDADKFEGRRT